MASMRAAVKATKYVAPAFRSPVGSRIGSRMLHTGEVKQMAGHGGGYEPDYIHAEHMYNLHAMKHRKLKIGLGVFGVLGVGIAVPIFAVRFQMKKGGG